MLSRATIDVKMFRGMKHGFYVMAVTKHKDADCKGFSLVDNLAHDIGVFGTANRTKRITITVSKSPESQVNLKAW